MTDVQEREAVAKAIIDSSLYLVLGTADQDGRPWVTPVYYAHSEYREFLWVSKPEARHSRNVATRSEVSIVVFDSSVPINRGQGVYMSADARELIGDDRAEGLDTYSRRALAHGGRPFALEDIEPPAGLRLYRATATDQYVLDQHDNRVLVGEPRRARSF